MWIYVVLRERGLKTDKDKENFEDKKRILTSTSHQVSAVLGSSKIRSSNMSSLRQYNLRTEFQQLTDASDLS